MKFMTIIMTPINMLISYVSINMGVIKLILDKAFIKR